MSTAPERLADAIMQEMARSARGALLPSVRQLQKRYRVSPVTVTKALSILKRRGLVHVRPGQGAFLAEGDRKRIDKDPSWQSLVLGAKAPNALEAHMNALPETEIGLNGGYLSADLQPLRELRKFAATTAARAAVWGQSPIEGLGELRAWFAEDVGAGYRPHDIVIAPGGQSAISTVFRAVGRPGGAILVESPTYVGALAAAHAAGLRVVPVPTDADGVRPDDLVRAFAETRSTLFYCQPLHSNPAGSTLAPDRRIAVVEAAQAANAFIVEDDSARHLHLDSKPPPAPLAQLDDSRVILIRSMTKPTAPSLRVAAICCKGPIKERIRSIRATDEMFVGGFSQELLLEFVTSPAWPKHLANLREAVRGKRDQALSAISESFGPDVSVSSPDGGLHLWLKLPDEIDESSLVAAAARELVRVSPGRIWFPAEPTAGFVRISFGGATPAEIEEGIPVLARLARQREAA